MKTRLKHILLGVISEVANEIQEFREAVARCTLNPSVDHCYETESYATITTAKEEEATSLRGGACVKEVGVASAASGRVRSNVQEQAREGTRFAQNSEHFGNSREVSQLPVNSFHNFNDVHFVSDVGEGPPVSGQLGHELLSMLRMARLKVKMERE